MNNFKQVGMFDPTNIKEELSKTPLWNWLNVRRVVDYSNHHEVKDIVLRFQPITGPRTKADLFTNLGCVDYYTRFLLPYTNELLTEYTKTRITGRAIIADLDPHSQIGTHIDEGEYCAAYNRYHFVITSNPDVIFKCDGEEVNMPEGTIWWFNNKLPHSVHNNSNQHRIHLVVDMW